MPSALILTLLPLIILILYYLILPLCHRWLWSRACRNGAFFRHLFYRDRMAVTDLPRTRWIYNKMLRKIVLKPDCFVFVTWTAPDTFFVPVRSFQGPD